MRMPLGVPSLLVLGGCITPDPTRLPPPAPDEPLVRAAPAAVAAPPRAYHELLGRSVEDRPIVAVSLGSGATTVLVLASIHGDEDAGTPLCERLVSELEREPAALAERRVVVVPKVNPDGIAHRTRCNARAVDLNRNFPASNWRATGANGPEPLSEPESSAIAELVRRLEPDRILSFHQPVGSIDYDGPARELARAMAAAGPLPVKRLGARPGSLGSWAGVDLGIPTITVELPRAAGRDGPDVAWERYGAMLLAAIAFE